MQSAESLVRRRGRQVDRRALTRILAAAGKDEHGRRCLEQDFEDVMFVGPVDFANVHFGKVSFRGATFQDAASFAAAVFHKDAQFACTTFEGTASFADAVFHGAAIFEHTETDPAHTDGARGIRLGRPEEVTFRRWADFRDATFEGGASFGGALFARRARFGGVTFGSPTAPALASFDGARFERARTLGPLLAYGKVSLDRAVFEGPVRIGISANQVSCVRTQFMARTSMELRWAGVDLEHAEFAQPSIVSGAPEPFELEDRTSGQIAAAGRNDPSWMTPSSRGRTPQAGRSLPARPQRCGRCTAPTSAI